jgi:hypothetical protein
MPQAEMNFIWEQRESRPAEHKRGQETRAPFKVEQRPGDGVVDSERANEPIIVDMFVLRLKGSRVGGFI